MKRPSRSARAASAGKTATDLHPAARPHTEAALVRVHVLPRASREEIAAVGGMLRVKLTAAPVEGAANAALIALLAGRLGVPRRAIQIVRGASSREKLVAVDGLTLDDFWKRIGEAPT